MHPKFNMKEFQLIKETKNKQVYYIKPDKRNGIVVIEKNEYIMKMERYLREGSYKEIKDERWKDGSPLNSMQKSFMTLLYKLKNNYNMDYNIANPIQNYLKCID